MHFEGVFDCIQRIKFYIINCDFLVYNAYDQNLQIWLKAINLVLGRYPLFKMVFIKDFSIQ